MPGLRAIATVMALCLGLASGAARPAWAAKPSGTKPGPEATEPRPTVMVWPGEPEAPIEQAEAALQTEDVSVVPQRPVREAVAGHRKARAKREQAQRARVEAALEAAQGHYLDLEFEPAIAALDAAEAEAIAVARPGRCDGLWELAFRQGLMHWANGETTDARARFELALSLEPERRPLAELYGPDVTAAFLQAVQTRTARIARPVPLRLQPADATVEIDCDAIDEPEPPLRPGLHAVRVAAPGFRPWAGMLDLAAQPVIEVTLEPLPAAGEPAQRWAESTDADAVDDASSSAHALVLELARAHGASAVLVVGPGRAGVRVRPWGSDSIGSPVERAELPPALHGALSFLGPDGRLQAPAPVIAPDREGDPRRRPDHPPRKPVLRTWWFWTIVGGAVTGTALGLGLGLGLGPREPAPGRLLIFAR